MPIPLLSQPQEQEEPKGYLRLVPMPVAVPASAHLSSRLFAHGIDLMVVQGCSLYCAKLLSLLLVSLHMPTIQGQGRFAGRVFWDAFTYGQGQLALVTFFFFSLAYFVGLPMWTGKTLGLGLLGLRLERFDGGRPSLRALWRRQMVCFFVYASGGLLLVVHSRAWGFIQDRFTFTRVVRES